MVAKYYYNDYTGKQPKYDKEEYADSTLKEHTWQKYHILRIRSKEALTAKGIASVVFVDIILRESAMIAHAVQIFTKDQVIIFEMVSLWEI